MGQWLCPSAVSAELVDLSGLRSWWAFPSTQVPSQPSMPVLESVLPFYQGKEANLKPCLLQSKIAFSPAQSGSLTTALRKLHSASYSSKYSGNQAEIPASGSVHVQWWTGQGGLAGGVGAGGWGRFLLIWVPAIEPKMSWSLFNARQRNKFTVTPNCWG